MKKIYMVFLAVVLLVSVSFGLYSLVDKDDETSQHENRGLKQKPEFSFASLFDGSYMTALDDYYSDQFPLRESLLKVDAQLNRFYNYTAPGDSGAVVIQTTNNVGLGGIGAAQGTETETPETPAEPENEPSTSPTEPSAPDNPTETAPETPEEPDVPEEEDPEFDNPENAQTAGSMLVVGDRALEIVYANQELEDEYAAAVNDIAAALGPNVKTYSLVTPNSAQFYGPEDLRSGQTDQEAIIDYVYSKLDSSITTVDAYSKLRSHIDEYIYFRTDHHWTQLGAYYAYTAFCEAAGLEAVALDEFETGQVTCSTNGATTFLGTLYNNVYHAAPTMAAAMEANPDTATYYMPVVKTNAIAYETIVDGELYGAYEGVTTVAKTVGDSYLYMAFISGDQHIEVIDTDVDNDKVCMVIKESYGNAFVPFLTSHYSKIVVVDPRYHNTSEFAPLSITELAQLEGVTDLIVINYPFIPQNQTYINQLKKLVS